MLARQIFGLQYGVCDLPIILADRQKANRPGEHGLLEGEKEARCGTPSRTTQEEMGG